MEIKRTANAGVLLKLDGVSILLDGVCREVSPYLATPPEERKALSDCWPDVLAFTHVHKDHYDPDFAFSFQEQTNGVILGPEDLPGCRSTAEPVTVRGVTVTPVRSRHIGKAGQTVSHYSFIITGTQCLWFLGDASPLQWRGREDLPAPNVLLVPYAYAATETGWQITKQLGAKNVILLHMPLEDNDPVGLWAAVRSTVGETGAFLKILAIGQTVLL